MTDSDFIIQEFHKTLTNFKEDEDKWENHTKAEYIKKCDELVMAQIDRGIINIEVESISSYLFKKINEFGIKCDNSTISRNIPDEHKRNYIKSCITQELEEPKYKKIETDDPTLTLEKDQFNDIKINGVDYIPKKAVKEKKESTVPVKEEKETNEYKYLAAMSKLANKFHLTFETLKNRYNESDEIQNIIDDNLGNVEAKLEEYAQAWASLENSKGMVDLRRTYGEYEKIMGAFMISTGETIARIAQLMDYSEKYGSIGLLREPRIIEFFETEDTYPIYLRSCPACLKDISQIMNRNISYYRECVEQGIDFKPINIKIPQIKYN